MTLPKILVTGANGFIGNRFLRSLDQDRYELFALDHHPPKDKDLKVKKFYQQDLARKIHLEEEFDFVFHLAALNFTHVGTAGYPEYHAVNVLGTHNLLNSVRTRHFVFMSTAKVYRCEGQVLDEDSPLGPAKDYERSKLEAEAACHGYFKGDHLTVFRPVNIVGPGQAVKAILPVFFKNARENLPLEILGSGKTRLQLLAVDDVIAAFKLLLQKENTGGIFNLASEDVITLEDLAQRIIRLTASRSEIKIDAPVEPPPFCKVESAKAKKVLGWDPQNSIDDILKQCSAVY